MKAFLRYLLAIALGVGAGFLGLVGAVEVASGVVLLPLGILGFFLLAFALVLFGLMVWAIPDPDAGMLGLVAPVLGMVTGGGMVISLYLIHRYKEELFLLSILLVAIAVGMVLLELWEKSCERNRKGADCAENGYC